MRLPYITTDYANFRDSSTYRQRLLNVRNLLYSPTVRCVDKSGQRSDRSNDTLLFAFLSLGSLPLQLRIVFRSVVSCGRGAEPRVSAFSCPAIYAFVVIVMSGDYTLPRSWFMNDLPILSRISSLLSI